MRLFLAGFVAGVLLLQCSPWLLPWSPLLAAVLVFQGILWWALKRRPLQPWLSASLLLLSALLLGYVYADLRAQWRLSDTLPHAWEGRDVTLEGCITELPEAVPNGMRFTFAVTQHLPTEAVVPHRLSLAWWGTALGTALG
ncbi:MAG: DUF4131 domain-containing protein, partial [Burkholderiales bacterium]